MRLYHESKALVAEAARLARRHAFSLGLIGIAGLLASLALMPLDARLLHGLTDNDTRALRDIARAISFWGDFPTGSLMLSLALLLFGIVARRPFWRSTAMATLLAAAIAGLTANCLRLSLGRPRPSADLADGLYGPRRGHRFHAFPSGHSATSMGSAAALAMAIPPAAAPALGAALAVGWSRIYLRQHHPSDVVAGFTLGALAGVAFGAAARNTREDPPTKGKGSVDNS